MKKVVKKTEVVRNDTVGYCLTTTRTTRLPLFTTLCSLASAPPHPASPSVILALHLQCPDPRHNSLHAHARSSHTGSTTPRRYDPPWTSSPAHRVSSLRHQPALAPMVFP